MLRLTTLGATDLRNRLGKPMREVLAQPKRLALLIYLAVDGKRGPVSRDRLLAMFWPESDTEHARNTLSQALHHLRQALGPGVIESQGVHAIGVDSEKLWCDAVVFGESLERGETELALDLYRGEFCPTLFVSGAPEVEEWLDEQRRRLRQQALAAARTLAERQLNSGDTDGAARAARRALALRPDEEADVRALLALLEKAGDGAGALLAYQDYARRLATELETEPAAETKQLAEAIRRRREAPPAGVHGPTAASPPAGAEILPAALTASATATVAPAGARAAATPRPWWRPATLAVVGVLAVAAGAAVVRSRAGRAATAPAKVIAVFPFTVRGSAALGYLREGMVDLLSAKLGGSVGIRALDPRAAISAAGDGAADADPAGSARLARRLDAAWFITGDVVEIAGRVQLNGALFAADGGTQAITTASVTGDTSALFQLVDDLTGQMLAGMIPGRDTSLTRLASVTTHSLPALKAFLQGEQALRAGSDAQAGAAFRDAALLDTSFALAQYRLALTANWVAVPDVNPMVWARIAASHAQHLTPQVRELLTAYQAYKDVEAETAERMYRALTAAYPDHVEAWLMLGETYFHYNWFRGRSPMDAWAPLQRVLTLDPGNVHALIHLARLAALEGRAEALDTLVATYLARYGAAAERALEMRALRAYLRDDSEERARIAREIRDADEVVAYSVLEAAVTYAQNPAAVAELAPRFAASRGESGVPRAMRGTARRLLASLEVATARWGRGDGALADGDRDPHDWAIESWVLLAAEKFVSLPRARVAALRDSLRSRHTYPVLGYLALSSPPGVSGGEMRTYLTALLDVRLGDVGDARQAAAVLAGDSGAASDRPATMLAHAIRAEIARTRGDPRGALAELDRFQLLPTVGWLRMPSHWGARERFLRAEALAALGRDAEAAAVYDSFVSHFDAPFLAVAHLRRAQIHARQGNPEQARFHFGRFLSLWKDADPEFRPLVEQARRELAALGPAPQ